MTSVNLRPYGRIYLWAKMSAVRGGVAVNDIIFLSDINGWGRWWFIDPLPTSWIQKSLRIKVFDGEDAAFDLSQCRYIAVWQSNVQTGDILRLDDVKASQ